MLRLDEEVLLAILRTKETLGLYYHTVRKYEVRSVPVLGNRLFVVDGYAFVVGGISPARDLLGQGFL